MHACAGSYLGNRSLPPLDRLPPPPAVQFPERSVFLGAGALAGRAGGNEVSWLD